MAVKPEDRAAVAAWISKRVGVKVTEGNLRYWERLGLLAEAWGQSQYAVLALVIASARKGGATLREVRYALAFDGLLPAPIREARRIRAESAPETAEVMAKYVLDPTLPVGERAIAFSSFFAPLVDPSEVFRTAGVPDESEAGREIARMEASRLEGSALANFAEDLAFEVVAPPGTVGRARRLKEMKAKLPAMAARADARRRKAK